MNLAYLLEDLFSSAMKAVGFLTGVLMIIFALFAVEARKIVDAVMALSALSMLSVLIFIVLKAPDVAITEAAVGSGLVTAVVIFALLKIEGKHGNGTESKGGGAQ